jgi:YVTN family beta-propeller protein
MADLVTLTRVPVPDSAVRLKFTNNLDIDQEAHRLYCGDTWTAGVDVWDVSTPAAKYVQTLPMRGLMAGIVVAREVKKLFVGLTLSLVAVVDLDPASPTFHKIIARVDTGGRGAADGIEYVPAHKKVYVGNHDDGFVAAIDAVENRLVATIGGLGAEVAQPRFNPRDGMVYVAGRTDNVLYQIDPATDTLVDTIHIDDPCHPSGIAINPETNQVVLACNNKQQRHAAVFNLTKKSVASVVEDFGGGDGVIYSAKVDRFFYAAEGDGGPVVGIFDGSGRLLATVPTHKGALWAAYDETNDLIYVAAIENGKPVLASFPRPASA